MLWRILQANGGALPQEVHAVFSNTGREMPATLDFVAEMSRRWSVPIVWLEFTARTKDGFREVGHNSASRCGEPFAALLAAQSALPNLVQRSCTQEMKVRTIKRWAVARGWKHWTNVVGLRADEPRRVERARRPSRDGWTVALPLADAGVTQDDVAAFWRAQPFDLRLAGPWEGNCDLCFLKSRAAIFRMMRDHPERAAWWAEMEAVPRGRAGRGRAFRADREGYAAMADYVRRSPMLPVDEGLVEGIGEACGGGCGI